MTPCSLVFKYRGFVDICYFQFHILKRNVAIFSGKMVGVVRVLPNLGIYIYIFFFFLLWRCDPTRVMAFSFLMFLDHTQRHTTVGRTRLEELSARRRDFYLTTHNTQHSQQMPMPPVVFEPTISAVERPQTYALDRAVTGTGIYIYIYIYIYGTTRRHDPKDKLIHKLVTSNPTSVDQQYCSPIYHLTLRLLMSYIYGSPILDVSRSHTTTQHSR